MERENEQMKALNHKTQLPWTALAFGLTNQLQSTSRQAVGGKKGPIFTSFVVSWQVLSFYGGHFPP